LNNQREITELYSELSYAELKTILENWLNPSAAATGDDEIIDELEAPKPKATTTTTATTKPAAKPNPDEEFGDLPWEKKAEPSKAKDDVASAFDDLFNN
jgi:hypothetical protein